MGCGCKDDAEPIMPVVRDNVPVTESDLEAKVRLLETELQMWKDSFNDLSNEYMNIVGDEDGLMPQVNTADVQDELVLQPNDREVEARMELRIKLLTVRDEISICDIFDAVQINVNDELEGISVRSIDSGVTMLDGEFFPEED